MKRWMPAVWVVGLALAASAQDKKSGDKIGKDKAPVVLKKALAEVQKRKNAAIAETAELGAGPQRIPSNFEGVLRKDLAAAKGAAEIYARGSTVLVNLGGRFDPPDELQGPEALSAQSFRNPSVLLDELGKNAAPAQFGPDEMVNGKDCKAVDVPADPVLLARHLKEFGDRLNKSMKAQIGLGGAQIFDLRNAMDEKTSAASYHVCVGKEDLLIYRVDFVLRPRFKLGSLPPQLKLPTEMEEKVDVKFSKWDEDVEFEIPAVVKAKFGIK